MNTATLQAVRALLKSDPMTPEQAGSLAASLGVAPDEKHDSLLTYARVARNLSVSPRQVLRWVSEGRLPAVRLGRRCTRIRAADVSTFIAAGCAAQAGGPTA